MHLDYTEVHVYFLQSRTLKLVSNKTLQDVVGHGQIILFAIPWLVFSRWSPLTTDLMGSSTCRWYLMRR